MLNIFEPPIIATGDNARAAPHKEQSAEEIHAMQNGWPHGIVRDPRYIAAQQNINARYRDLLDNAGKPQPKRTTWWTRNKLNVLFGIPVFVGTLLALEYVVKPWAISVLCSQLLKC